MAHVNRHDGSRQPTAAFLLYQAFAILVFGRALLGHLTTFCIGQNADPPIYIWFLRWWRYAIESRVNPFLTDLIWAPRGFNLAWAAFIPLPAWIAIPIEHALGETAAYNILCIVALPLAAVSAFLLCRRVTGAFWPSILGGYIFGFSPYMLGELLGGHLNLTLAFSVPLAVLAVLRRLDREINSRRFTLEVAALLVVQFLCGIEVFATMTVFAGFAILVALVFFEGETRTRLVGLIAPLAAAYALAMILVSPYLYYLFALGSPHGPLWTPDRFVSDLLNLFVPTELNFLGTFGFARAITEKFSGDIFENDAYIGIPLLVVIEAYRRMAWRTPAGKFLIAMLAITVVASFGPMLRVAGHPVFPMPWAVFAILPVISGAIAARLAIYTLLVISLIAAIWFTNTPARLSTKCFAALLIGLFFAPNRSASFWISSLDIPVFFADRAYAKELHPREIVLPLPFPNDGQTMYWQAQSDMYFRMAGGWTTTSPFEFIRMPVINYFYGGIDLPEAADQLKAYIVRFGVQAMIVDPREPNFQSFKPTLDSLGLAELEEKGVSIYKIPPDSFAAYANLPAAQVEARANALRFDAILEAAAKYLADGNDLSKLSALELKRLDLVPRDWLVDSAPHAYTDWQIGPAPGGRVGIITVGSFDGLRPLIARYRTTASEIEYPAPTRWTPDSRPPLDVIKPLLVIFDSDHLADAAKSLRDSPPPERTTPFVVGVSQGL